MELFGVKVAFTKHDAPEASVAPHPTGVFVIPLIVLAGDPGVAKADGVAPPLTVAEPLLVNPNVTGYESPDTAAAGNPITTTGSTSTEAVDMVVFGEGDVVPPA